MGYLTWTRERGWAPAFRKSACLDNVVCLTKHTVHTHSCTYIHTWSVECGAVCVCLCSGASRWSIPVWLINYKLLHSHVCTFDWEVTSSKSPELLSDRTLNLTIIHEQFNSQYTQVRFWYWIWLSSMLHTYLWKMQNGRKQRSTSMERATLRKKAITRHDLNKPHVFFEYGFEYGIFLLNIQYLVLLFCRKESIVLLLATD